MTQSLSTTCSANRFRERSQAVKRRGLTLIEVIAAIAILGTVLAGIVLAKARHTRQLTRAQAQSQAVDAADRLITDWWADVDTLPIGEAGPTPSDARFRWQTRLVDNPAIRTLGARVVRVAIHDTTGDPQRQPDNAGPLVEVDLVVPDPQVEARERLEDARREQTQRKQSAPTRREADDA